MKTPVRSSVTALAVTLMAAMASMSPATAAPEPSTGTGGSPVQAEARAVAGTPVYVWATDVRVRPAANRIWDPIATVSRTWLESICQMDGEYIHDPAVGGNSWWTFVRIGNQTGAINNLYIRGGQMIEGVPVCSTSGG
ncbi:peptidase M23 [Streptomyces coeruleorubidus]|uniref:peptidase M23 n=1 Tax=Streptomyces coeruleorubidus TaxID=116188 RepID=UPI00237F8CA7|nr:peptidase M23 [Streptomyces coeruleorubidus]WDV56182.1 peptidase M23 [Streptomyces coeruleorubidus]